LALDTLYTINGYREPVFLNGHTKYTRKVGIPFAQTAQISYILTLIR